MIDPGTLTLTLITLVAFASNSLLTRLALGHGQIDAATFTSLRLLGGAMVLALMVRARSGSWSPLIRGRAVGPLVLFGYAVPFSFAYVRIAAATGALVLFGLVQLTMVGYGISQGQRPTGREWIGLALAGAGLISLTLPSAARPDPIGVLLMALAGVGWGAYSLVGRASANPILTNAQSFVWSLPMAIVLSLMLRHSLVASRQGIVLAIVCGGLTSGLGYVIWYRALAGLSVTQGAAVQLGVPVIAALGGVVLLDERLSVTLLISGAAILAGIALVLAARVHPSGGGGRLG